jgi:hypothetical protein
MNISELDDALSAALNSLAAAQAVLRKSLPGRSIDVLRKTELADAEPRANGDDFVKALALLEDHNLRYDAKVADFRAQMDDLQRRIDELKEADAARANADRVRS